MSSILIKGMEMPTSCLNCFVSRGKCKAVLQRIEAMNSGTWVPANYRHEDCPLAPVSTPHGRCIDTDALIKKIPVVSYEIYENVRTLLENAPTIIPAEEDE